MIAVFGSSVNALVFRAGGISRYDWRLIMEVAQREWRVAAKLDPQTEQQLSAQHPLMRQILFNRGVRSAAEAERYLQALPPEVNDPFLIKDMDLAVDRLVRAIQQGERIIIYGDYDADGVTATALLLDSFGRLGAQVRPYIPNRFEEGYGLNIEALRTLKEEGADLVVSVDCGIRSLKEAAEARRLDLDLIITDHHSPGPEMPEAFAVINTKQPGDAYPEKQLAGVGTAYKLACAVQARLQPGAGTDTSLLDLVALGTVADMVPLAGENRWMVRNGVARLRQPARQGVWSLMGASGVKPAKVTAGDIGYLLGPRLNAAGRLETALNALNLLVSTDLFEAGRLAQYLDSQNRERQALTREMTATAEEIVAGQSPDDFLLVAAHEQFNPGVVGLVASRLVEKFYRPAIVAHRGPEFTRASCRSIPELHITDALQTCADLFTNFGGHAAAAGFTVPNQHYAEAIQRLQALTREKLGSLQLRQVLRADAELPLIDLKPDLLGLLEQVEPTGMDNPQVNLVSRGLNVRDARGVGEEGAHLKLKVSDGWITYDAIAFRQGHWMQKLPPRIDLLYRFEANEFNGRTSLQLNVRDLRPSD